METFKKVMSIIWKIICFPFKLAWKIFDILAKIGDSMK